MAKRKRFKPPRFATVVGEGTVIRGDLIFRDGLHVDGEIYGNLTGAADDDRSTLTLSDRGKIVGDVHVANVIINGLIEGNVYANSRVELAEEARITGKVHYKLLEMSMGAEVNGEMICREHMESGENPKVAPVSSLVENLD